MSDGAVPLCSDHDGLRTPALDCPHRKNAITRELWITLAQGLIDADRDVDLREGTYA